MRIASSPHFDDVRTLIDSGAPVNLIDEASVNRHNLRRCSLHAPIPLTDTFDGKGRKATEWCKFTLTTANNAFSSRTIHAIIVPSLCYPLILGVPFLSQSMNVLHPDSPAPVIPPVPLALCSVLHRKEDCLKSTLRLAQHRDLLRDIALNVPTTPAEPNLPGPSLSSLQSDSVLKTSLSLTTSAPKTLRLRLSSQIVSLLTSCTSTTCWLTSFMRSSSRTLT